MHHQNVLFIFIIRDNVSRECTLESKWKYLRFRWHFTYFSSTKEARKYLLLMRYLGRWKKYESEKFIQPAVSFCRVNRLCSYDDFKASIAAAWRHHWEQATKTLHITCRNCWLWYMMQICGLLSMFRPRATQNCYSIEKSHLLSMKNRYSECLSSASDWLIVDISS